MAKEITPSEMDRMMQRLTEDLGGIMKERLINKMGEIIKPELDKILEETAEEMMKSFKARITSHFDIIAYGYVFNLIIDKNKKEIK